MNEPTLVLVTPGQMGIVSCMLELDERNEKEKRKKEKGTYVPNTREPYTGTNPQSPM